MPLSSCIISQSTCTVNIISIVSYLCRALRAGCTIPIPGAGAGPQEQRTRLSDGLLSSDFLYPQNAISLFVLNLYHSMCHKRIRRHQAGKSSTWKILTSLIRQSSITWLQSITPESPFTCVPKAHHFFSLGIHFFQPVFISRSHP